MAIYRIFPVQDTTLYSEYNAMNSGMDAILELSKIGSIIFTSSSTATRPLIKFDQSDIDDIFEKYVNPSSSYECYFKMYLADAGELPVDYNLELYALNESWVNGTGKYGNIPEIKDGATWKFRGANGTNAWTYSGFPVGITGSFRPDNPGGGTWYTGSKITQSFNVYSDLDVYMNVTTIVDKYRSGSYENHGFILKNTDSIEFDRNYLYKLTYFSRDTNTVYPPCLEIKWNDLTFNTGSSSFQVLNTSDFILSTNNKGEYREDEIFKMRINVRDKYPARTFTTSSLFTKQRYLPSGSSYSIIDHKTKDVIYDFDPVFTGISRDEKSSYFNIYMNGMEPGRFYRVLIKVPIDGQEIISDQGIIFKIL